MHLAYFHYLCEGSTGLHHVRQFSEAARALGHRVDVHAMNLAPTESGSDDPSRALRLRSALKSRFSRYLHEPKELAWNLPYLRKETAILRSSRPDLVLARNDTFVASIVWAARRQQRPLVLEFNAPAVESRLYWDEYFHLPAIPEWLEGWKLRRADALVTVSSALRDYLVESHRIAEDKFTVAPNGVATDLFRPDVPAESELPESFAGATIVGFVGSFQKFHGVDLLCEMALRVASERPEIRFLFAGDGPGLELARRRTKPLGDRVFFPGDVPHEQVPSVVGHIDVAVLPETAFYTSPLKVLEWMAAARAIVAPSHGTILELLTNGSEALLFPPGEVDALARSVVRLVDSPDLRRALGRAAHRRALSGFTWRHNAERVLVACERALSLRA